MQKINRVKINIKTLLELSTLRVKINEITKQHITIDYDHDLTYLLRMIDSRIIEEINKLR